MERSLGFQATSVSDLLEQMRRQKEIEIEVLRSMLAAKCEKCFVRATSTGGPILRVRVEEALMKKERESTALEDILDHENP